MREKTNNQYFERVGSKKPRVERRFVFVVCEGAKTEPKYLKQLCLKNKRQYVRFLSTPCSNPLKIMESIVDLLDKMCIDYTPISIANAILDALAPDEKDGKRIISCSQSVAHGHNIKDNDTISEDGLPFFFNDLVQKLGKEIREKIAIEAIRENHMIDLEYDQVYLVSDRDCQSFTKSQCQTVINLCREYNVKYILTNPCIEFFFLLHWTDCRQYDKETIKKNKKSGNRTFVHAELSKYDPNYGKTSFNCEKYFEKYFTAKSNINKYSIVLDELVNNIGSNFCDLVDLILHREE